MSNPEYNCENSVASNKYYTDIYESPLVSIIMPIRNEARYIHRSLTSLLRQDYPKDKMEIIIVDGCSTDGTRKIIEEYKEKNPEYNIIILDNPKKIVSSALNIGLREAKGEIIIRVDGHCQIASNYVRRCVEVLNKTGADCVGGHQNPVGENFLGKAIALATKSIFGTGRAKFRHLSKSGWTDTVYMGAYLKNVFEKIGNFDEELIRNQDDEFNFRLIQQGGKIWLDPSIRSIYYVRSTLSALWRQYFEYGLWKVRVFQKRGEVFSLRHLIPMFFVLGLVFSLLLVKINSIFICIPLVYVIVNLIVSIWVSRRRLYYIVILPIIFFILHFSYGWGFIFGLWRWRKYKYRFFRKSSRPK